METPRYPRKLCKIIDNIFINSQIVVKIIFKIVYHKITKSSINNFRKKILVGTTMVMMMIRPHLVAATLMVPGVQVKLQ